MTKKQICVVLLLLFFMFLFIFSLNFYFLNRLDKITSTNNEEKLITNIEYILKQRIMKLKPAYLNKNPRYFVIKKNFFKNLYPKKYKNCSEIWKLSNTWPYNNEIYPENDATIGQALYALQQEEILSAKNSPRGTQLKLLLNLTGSQTVLFKPKWYSRNHIVRGPVYGGKDRHNSEIFAFYLGSVLNLRYTPLVTGRKVNLKQIYEKADTDLRNTMVVEGNGTKYCVYGKCHYCKSSDRICAKEDFMIEGVVLSLIPGIFSKHRSPWQRTYKEKHKAKWEEDDNYCESLKQVYPETRLLDLVDASIFDFLIQNGDRHHYETRNEGILLLDNGKGFGNPYIDFIDILAPLYQCCIIRRSTWSRLLIFSGGSLTELIENLTKFDPLYPILIEEHYTAVERRLLFVYGAVELCIEKYGKDIFR